MAKKKRKSSAKASASVGLLDTAELTGDSDNPRKITDKAAKGLGSSLDRFGDLSGIVWNRRTGELVAGHQRMAEIRKRWGDHPIQEIDPVRGLYGIAVDDKHFFPVRVVDWSKAMQRAANVTANSQRIAGEFTDELSTYLLEIQAEVEEESPGLLTDLLLVDLMAADTADGFTDADEVPEPPAEPITQPGDLWLLGEHRLLCGDSTKAEDVGLVMDGTFAQMVFTDPPYGVDIQERDMAQAEVRGRRKDGKGVANDDLTGDELVDFLAAAFSATLARTDPGACWYVCGPPGVDYRHPMNILADLGVARHGIVWVKDRFVMGRADYHYQHESIIYGWTPGGAHKRVPTRDQSTVWEFARPGRSPEHPTMKPVALVSKAIGNSSVAGDLVFDPFLGSGTTLIAAEQLGRRCYGLEISPAYCDVIVQRWQNLTGKTATRQALEAVV